MEANFFRCFIRDLGKQLPGLRIEKVYESLPNVWTIQCRSNYLLIFIPSAKEGALFSTSSKPDNPVKPSSGAQWWRKRIGKRYFRQYLSNWANRQIAFQLSPGPGQWLLFDLTKGLQLLDDLPEDFTDDPSWPDIKDIVEDKEIFRKYPQISPPLRRTIHALPSEQAVELLNTLQDCAANTFYLYTSSDQTQTLLPWKLPESLAEGKQLDIFSSALQAAEVYGWRVLLKKRSSEGGSKEWKKKSVKRIERNLDNLQKDEQRLREMVDLQESAEILQSNLYAYNPNMKASQIKVHDGEGNCRIVNLNPEHTLKQNMEIMFKKARKGRRGLEKIAERRRQLQEEIERLSRIQEERYITSSSETKEAGKRTSKAPFRFRGLNIHMYLTSDGFTVVKGRNAKSNHKLLSQAAKPFDLWFHVHGGPGAHVVLRRDHENQEVPRQSLNQAAVIAALASYKSNEEKARVLCSQVKAVRKSKGAALGHVNVDYVLETFLVNLDKQLEESLKVSGY